jgi:ATP-binding cassette subfamily C protein
MITSIKSFYSILSGKQRKFIIYLIILSFIGALLELISLGLLIPIIGVLNKETLNNNHLANNIFVKITSNLKNFIDDTTILILTFFFIIFVIKTLFFTFLVKLNNIFARDLNFTLSSKIFENYLFQKYYFYLSRGSSKLIQNITNEINNLINIYFASLLSLFNEILLLISISALLIFISPISFFSIILVFFIFSFLFFLIIKNNLKKWGYQRQQHQENSIRYLQEGIRGIKELRVYNLENSFLEYFKFHTKKFLKIEAKINFISTIPKYYIELLGVISFVIIFKVLLLNNYSSNEIILVLGVFAASTLKVLPSINRIINSIVKIKYSYSAVEVIFNEVKLKKNYHQNLSKKKISPPKNLILNKVYFKYQNSNFFLFKNTNLKIPLKKVIGVFGDSGSGKTTFVDLIIGFLRPTKGTVCADGINIFKHLRSWQNNIGMFSNFHILPKTLLKEILVLDLKIYQWT